MALLLGFGVLIATGINFGTIIPAATAVTRWFSRYRGRAMAVTLSASGVAGLFVSRLLNGVLTANGGNWRKGWTIVAGVFVLSSIMLFLFVKERPGSWPVWSNGVWKRANRLRARRESSSSRLSWEPRQLTKLSRIG